MAHTPKAEALAHWQDLPEGQNPLPLMEAIPYKATGSSYGTCGVRIDGTPEFIDAVLSNLKPLLDGENHTTRLELSRSDVQAVRIGEEVKRWEKAGLRAQVCYVRLHVRGHEAQHAAGLWGLRPHDRAVARW
jgi:hypothetical protein